MLSCPDSIEHLPRKMWWLYEYLLRTVEFDFFLKLDDDGYVHTQALNIFFERLKRERRSLTHYMGSRILDPTVQRSNVWHVGKTPSPTFTEKPRGIS